MFKILKTTRGNNNFLYFDGFRILQATHIGSKSCSPVHNRPLWETAYPPDHAPGPASAVAWADQADQRSVDSRTSHWGVPSRADLPLSHPVAMQCCNGVTAVLQCWNTRGGLQKTRPSCGHALCTGSSILQQQKSAYESFHSWHCFSQRSDALMCFPMHIWSHLVSSDPFSRRSESTCAHFVMNPWLFR